MDVNLNLHDVASVVVTLIHVMSSLQILQYLGIYYALLNNNKNKYILSCDFGLIHFPSPPPPSPTPFVNIQPIEIG